MKKKLFTLIWVTAVAYTASAQRFVTEVFPSYMVSSNIIYANNISVFPPPTPTAIDLRMDVYEPDGAPDTMTKRPLIIFMHTGSYLPPYINETPTGSRHDSAAVEICSRFARRGYVVASIDYRLGWNPAGSNVDIRRGTLLNAVYRSVQDAKAAVRFFRKDAATLNIYQIDSTKIILGGQGTGGYVAVNYAVLNDPAQITLPKFISNITDPNYGFVQGQPYVNQAALGDYDGYGGIPLLNNPNNSPGYGNDVQFVFNLGGALGDSSWLKAGAAPMVAFHVTSDPFAPYGNGIVYVPGNPPQSVVDVSGSGVFIARANELGNNACFENNTFNDVYTQRANAVNGGEEGLFPLNTSTSPQAGPWEWFDSTTTVMGAIAVGKTAAEGTTIYNNAKLTNPDMSKAKAMAYIDTIMGYLNPRIAMCLNLLPTGVKDVAAQDNSIEIYPNPVRDLLTVRTSLQDNRIISIHITDMTGRTVKSISKVNASTITLRDQRMAPGMYLISVHTTKGKLTKKLVIH